MRPIDADALNEAMYHEAFDTDSEDQKWDSGCWIRYRMFERNLKSAPTITLGPEWISVKDRLPKSGTKCLTYSPKGRMRVAEAFLPSTIPGSTYEPMECWWTREGRSGDFVAVTHWIPLPEPPKEEDE